MQRRVLAAVYIAALIFLNLWPVKLYDGYTGHAYCCQEILISHYRGWPAPFYHSVERWSYPDELREAIPVLHVDGPGGDENRQAFDAAWETRWQTAERWDLPLPHYTYVPCTVLNLFRSEAVALILGALLDLALLCGGSVLILYAWRRPSKQCTERPPEGR